MPVVVDDGSTDNTPSVIQKFLPRVKYLRKKNGGQASAFNAAFPEVHGQILALLDGDDWFAEGKLAAVLGALEQNPEVAAVGHGYYKFHEETKKVEVCALPETTLLNLATPDAARAAVRGWRFLLLGALTVRRKVLEQTIPIPEVLVFSADNPIQVASMAMGALLLKEPFCYYRHHVDNLYAIGPENATKVRRKCEMVELTCSLLYPMLIRLGVPEESVSTLLSGDWVEAKRTRRSRFGGSRLEAFQTEMQAFRASFKNPSVGYRLFKYVAVGAATLALPVRHFYKLRDWYAALQLGRYRQRLFEEDVTVSSFHQGSPEK
jgi:glycosyltransferase involved in cell wall biosynthesis